MARIKGKWVGQVVVEYTADIGDGTAAIVELWAKKWLKGKVKHCVKFAIPKCITPKITVTQLHADLYRDEPSEWTKEEAT